MADINDRKLKAEIDEIIKKVNAIIKNIDELDPAKGEDLESSIFSNKPS
jgi:hypothetical protein